jgi:thiol-disulfide isomerase/thioredoxin
VRLVRLLLVLVLVLVAAGCRRSEHPALAIGAVAPAWSLRGVDGKTHALADYAQSPVLAVVFTCNHCPAAELYEERIARLYATYHDKGLALVAVNPDSTKTVRLDEMGYTDVDDSPAGMKARATFRKLPYPYLYDGDGQTTAAAFGVETTPEIFVFDRERTLRYHGRIDDNADESRVTSRDAQEAIEALLAARPVRVATTAARGCPIRWLSQTSDVVAEQTAIEREPVTVEPIGEADLTKLRGNGTNQITLVNFWATWCAPCIGEFPELQQTYRMYKGRGLRFVTVSANTPAERTAVLAFLREYHATSTNRQFDSDNIEALETAFDPKMPAALPFTLLLAPNGDVLHQQLGEADVPQLRRAILASLADDPQHPGMQKHWKIQ